ncbi:hypothetical protein D3C86_1587980 [compost metagenome]
MATASRIGASSCRRWPNMRLQQISCFAAGSSSRPRQAVPRSSRAVFSTTTEKRLRMVQGSAWARSHAVRMPIAARCSVSLRPMPHTSPTSPARSSLSRRCGSRRSTTPPVCRCQRLAAWLASLASVLLLAIPTPTGMPVQRSTVARICRPSASRLSGIPVSSANASSMLYTSSAGSMPSSRVITRWLMSPYSA